MDTSSVNNSKNTAISAAFYTLASEIVHKSRKAHKALADWSIEELLVIEEGFEDDYNCLKLSFMEKERLNKVRN